ncbi:MAG: circadian clock protein KaiA [Nostocaceae cyanobacterium]|nr:circadian clock protein KaiA [Nostocaceae cyanobacterium]
MLYPSELVVRKNLFWLITQSIGTIYQSCDWHITRNPSYLFQDLLLWLKQPRNQHKIFEKLYVLRWQKKENRQFFSEMDAVERQNLLRQIKKDYSQILISYFTTDRTVKDKIDKFVNLVFCAKIPVPQIIEIHMDLIEEFSNQLKLEGRNDEALLDYRLTLIDILAHLCEAYRCSMPK